MKKNGFSRFTSIFLTLCIVLSCVTVSFSTVGAATMEDANQESVSADSSEPNADFSWDNASVYFLLTDRFKNGNTSNDHSYNRGLDQNGNVASINDTGATFHGGDFAGVTQAIEEGYFTNLGVNALWISAPYEQIHGYVVGGDGSPSYAHYAYHGYYVLDYTQTDANFGTAEEFETLVDTAHKHGIRVVMDIVLNHAGYNSMYDMAEYGFGTIKSGWESTYYNYNSISNSTYHANIDYESSASDWGKWWGPSWIRSGLPGYTEGGGDDRTMSLSGLPDFKTESTATVSVPQFLQTKWQKEGRLQTETNDLNSYFSKTGKSRTVTNTISYWLTDWVRQYGVDGFRCDTAKHVEYASWKALKDAGVAALKEWRQNNPSKPGANWDEDFWMTGEHWDHGVYKDEYYTEGGFDSMINFTTQGGGLVSQANVKSTYNGFATSINSDSSFNVLSYISSHDSVLARGDQIALGSAFQLLPGGIQIYYGDETNRPLDPSAAANGQHNLRSDMNWDSMDTNVLSHWQKVGTFRNNHISVGAGSNTDLSSSSGYAFGRTYSKDGLEDKVAGCIYASANTDVTIDVSSLWADGQYLVNAYDQSSAVVSNGKVTFNSGDNKTILIQEPDGKPLMSVKGNAQFVGTQTVTVSLEECDSAKASIDGGNKFVVTDGSTFEIGNTAYEGDTITVALEAENEKGTSKASFTFKKISQSEAQETTVPTTAPQKAQLIVKTWDGSAPYAYVWTGTSTALAGAWPGTKLTTKNSDGNYVLDLDTTDTYNVVLNNGSGTQSDDIKGLKGTATVEVTNSSYASKIVSNGSTGGDSEPTEDSVTIRVKPYGSTTPNLYVWTDTDGALLGAWPGKTLSEKDSDGNYIVTIENQSTVNAIVNLNGGQTADITGLSGDVTIEITNSGCTSYKLTKNVQPVSGMALLKQEAREVKAMTANDYTSASWSNLSSLMTSVDALVAQGDSASDTAIEEMIAKLQSAKSNLKLATPTLSYAVVGQSGVKGYSAPEATVTVTVGSQTYTVTADDVTGEFEVNSSALTSSTAIKVSATRNDISSDTLSYNMSSGNITGGNPPTQPATVQPTTATQATTKATSQPTTASRATQPATSSKNFTVTGTSNFFPESTQTFDADTDTVTVTYYINSNKKLFASQWSISYDPTVLAYNESKNSNVTDFMPFATSGTYSNVNPTGESGKIYGSIAKASLESITSNGKEVAFVTVTFDVLKATNTSVNLDVEVLELSDENFNDELIVENSKVVAHTTTVNTSTKTYEGTYSGEDPTVPPTTVQPTTVQPTTAQPTTVSPTTSDKLTVKGTSNFFPESIQTFDADTDTVTVTYYINSSKKLWNSQWVLSYDPSVLSYNEEKNSNVTDFMPFATSGTISNVNPKGESGTIYGNVSSSRLESLTTESGDKVAFVTVTFDVLKAESTTVDLNVEVLYLSDKDYNDEAIVEDSVIQTHETNVDVSTKVYEGTYTGEDPVDKLTVTAKSNFFPESTQTFDADTDTVTVTYYIQSTKDLYEINWKLTYDPEVLKYNESKNTGVDDFMPCVTSGALSNNPRDGVILANCTSLKLNSLSTASGSKVALVSVTFDVLKQTSTEVNLDITDFTIASLNSSGKLDSSTEERVIFDSVIYSSDAIVDISSAVYEGEYVAPTTYLYGDVNLDGRISITDASIIQNYLTEEASLSDLQLKLADVTGEGRVSIADASMIQKYLAEMPDSGKVGQPYN